MSLFHFLLPYFLLYNVLCDPIDLIIQVMTSSKASDGLQTEIFRSFPQSNICTTPGSTHCHPSHPTDMKHGVNSHWLRTRTGAGNATTAFWPQPMTMVSLTSICSCQLLNFPPRLSYETCISELVTALILQLDSSFSFLSVVPQIIRFHIFRNQFRTLSEIFSSFLYHEQPFQNPFQ